MWMSPLLGAAYTRLNSCCGFAALFDYLSVLIRDATILVFLLAYSSTSQGLNTATSENGFVTQL